MIMCRVTTTKLMYHITNINFEPHNICLVAYLFSLHSSWKLMALLSVQGIEQAGKGAEKEWSLVERSTMVYTFLALVKACIFAHKLQHINNSFVILSSFSILCVFLWFSFLYTTFFFPLMWDKISNCSKWNWLTWTLKLVSALIIASMMFHYQTSSIIMYFCWYSAN